MFQKGRAIDTGEVEIGAQVMQTIPPGLFWRFQITIHHPVYLKFNISLAKDSLLGIYGRRNIPPTHTQVIGNDPDSITLIFSVRSGWECSQRAFKAEREERTGCNQSGYLFFFWALAIAQTMLSQGTVSYQTGQQLWPQGCHCLGGWTGTRCPAAEIQCLPCKGGNSSSLENALIFLWFP